MSVITPERKSFQTYGKLYVETHSLFMGFVQDILGLANEIPSLVFDRNGTDHLDFTLMGSRRRIKYSFLPGNDPFYGVITLLYWDEDAEAYKASTAITMDKLGNLMRGENRLPLSIRSDAERVFYYLILGQ